MEQEDERGRAVCPRPSVPLSVMAGDSMRLAAQRSPTGTRHPRQIGGSLAH